MKWTFLIILLSILMHGIFSSKDYNPMPALARGLAAEGENHMITRRRKEVVNLAVSFFGHLK